MSSVAHTLFRPSRYTPQGSAQHAGAEYQGMAVCCWISIVSTVTTAYLMLHGYSNIGCNYDDSVAQTLNL